jgi:hypothetical protein
MQVRVVNVQEREVSETTRQPVQTGGNHNRLDGMKLGYDVRRLRDRIHFVRILSGTYEVRLEVRGRIVSFKGFYSRPEAGDREPQVDHLRFAPIGTSDAANWLDRDMDDVPCSLT